MLHSVGRGWDAQENLYSVCKWLDGFIRNNFQGKTITSAEFDQMSPRPKKGLCLIYRLKTDRVIVWSGLDEEQMTAISRAVSGQMNQ